VHQCCACCAACLWPGKPKHLSIVVAAVLPSVRRQRIKQGRVPDAGHGEGPLRKGQPGNASVSAAGHGISEQHAHKASAEHAQLLLLYYCHDWLSSSITQNKRTVITVMTAAALS